MNKFIKAIITFSLKNKLLVFLGTILIVALGVRSFLASPIEAFPDVINTRVVIITQWPGRSAEEMEKFVTIPVEMEMNVVPKKTLRSISLFGLSVVTIFFEDEIHGRGMFADRFQSALMAGLGLLPAALSTRIGSETQKPLAVVVICGLISATIWTLVTLPAIYQLWNKSIGHKV